MVPDGNPGLREAEAEGLKIQALSMQLRDIVRSCLKKGVGGPSSTFRTITKSNGWIPSGPGRTPCLLHSLPSPAVHPRATSGCCHKVDVGVTRHQHNTREPGEGPGVTTFSQELAATLGFPRHQHHLQPSSPHHPPTRGNSLPFPFHAGAINGSQMYEHFHDGSMPACH